MGRGAPIKLQPREHKQPTQAERRIASIATRMLRAGASSIGVVRRIKSANATLPATVAAERIGAIAGATMASGMPFNRAALSSILYRHTHRIRTRSSKPFARLKALLRKAAPRDGQTLWRRIGAIVESFTSTECASYFSDAGYGHSP
jgi:hypothetical protein